MIRPLLNAELAARFAEAAMANIRRTWPQRVDGIQADEKPLPAMELQHPAFHGSFDWHSCVHMHWLLARLMLLFPGQAWEVRARELLDQRLSAQHLQVEQDYFESPHNHLFERPYGWAWLFKLLSGLRALQGINTHAGHWVHALSPLAQLLTMRFQAYLGRLAYPVRAGTHGNSAFAMLLALDLDEPVLTPLIGQRARDWFLADRNYPAAYEPDGEDFLSGGLSEAALMSRVLSEREFECWWRSFRPDEGGWKRWQVAVEPTSRTDGRLVHLAGLNLSRAWCLRQVASKLPAQGTELERIAQIHISASLPHVTGEDFAGDHWLASFAALALAPLD